MTPVTAHRGDSPIVLGLPHTGTFLPDAILSMLNDTGRQLADTDWHIERLYGGLFDGATTVRATFHRYVIDANRDPAGVSLYPGQNTTALVPLTDFNGAGIWQTPPDADDIAARQRLYHAAYHNALAAELDRVRARHGVAILFDCHSIRSRIPYLFDGRLPDFNIGTNDGASCCGALETAAYRHCNAAEGFSCVLNGRFKGGWTTRHYGRPDHGIHAIQMELAQSAYLSAEAPPWTYDATKAARLRPVLASLLGTLADIALNGDLT